MGPSIRVIDPSRQRVDDACLSQASVYIGALATRARGTLLAYRAFTSALGMPVSVTPGTRQFTWILKGASSLAQAFVRPNMAAFELA